MEASLAKFLETIVTALGDLSFVPYAVPLVVLLVSLIKRIPGLDTLDGKLLHLAVQVVFWVLYAAVNHFGHGEQLQQWTEALTIILQTLLPLIASMFGATWLYDKAHENNIPVIGYRRTKDTYARPVG